MKITNYIIVFAVLILVSIFAIDNKISTYSELSNKRQQYNRNLDTAVDDALRHLVEVDDGKTLKINKDTCVENFYKSLYASFGASDSPAMQEMLKLYTPVMVLTDRDGYYVHYVDVKDGAAITRWTQKKPYTFRGANYTLAFTLGNDVTIYVDGDSRAYNGDYRNLKDLYPPTDPITGEVNEDFTRLASVIDNSILADPTEFDRQRRSVIIRNIVSDMTYYVNKHNDVADNYGIQYVFNLPETVYDDTARTVDDINLLVVFQGYPYGSGINDVYNKIAIGGARITKNNYYCVTKDEVNGLFYHKGRCGLANASNEYYSTREECAELGARPCPYCNP